MNRTTRILALCSTFAPGLYAQATPTAELDERVRALREAKTTEAKLAAWLEIEKFVPAAKDLPAAARTDAIAAGLAVDFGTEIFHVRVFKLLGSAPDPKRAGKYLLEACRAQAKREKEFAAKKRPTWDAEELEILAGGRDNPLAGMNDVLNQAIGLETLELRKSIVAACVAISDPQTTQGLSLIVPYLDPDPADAVVGAFLARPAIESIDGLLLMLSKCEARHAELKDAVKQAKKRKPRPVPFGQTKSKWKKTEKQITRKLVALHTRRLKDFEKGLADLAKRAGAFAKTHDLPAPPRKGLPVRAWKSWRERTAKVLDKR